MNPSPETCPTDNKDDKDATRAQLVDDFLNNGYMTFEEFVERVKKLIRPNDK
ncbi:MAG: hypothetical protein IJP77_09265 [Bacteroidales bacterium]|nr:hypothetical protein [Bacteroidales bacterium]